MWTGTVCVPAGAAESLQIVGPTGTVGRARESARVHGSVCAVVASRRCQFPPISLPRCSSSAARWTRPLRIRMRGVSVPLFSRRLPLSESNSSSPWLGGLGQSLAGMARGRFTFAPRALPCLVPAARRV